MDNQNIQIEVATATCLSAWSHAKFVTVAIVATCCAIIYFFNIPEVQAMNSSIIGTWTSVSAGGFSVQDQAGQVSSGRGGEGMIYEFKPDGTYVYTASFDIVISSTTISIYEKGNFRVQSNVLTLTPVSKRYRRNGVDEGDVLKVRSFNCRMEPNANPSKRNLILWSADNPIETVFTQ